MASHSTILPQILPKPLLFETSQSSTLSSKQPSKHRELSKPQVIIHCHSPTFARSLVESQSHVNRLTKVLKMIIRKTFSVHVLSRVLSPPPFYLSNSISLWKARLRRADVWIRFLIRHSLGLAVAHCATAKGEDSGGPVWKRRSGPAFPRDVGPLYE